MTLDDQPVPSTSLSLYDTAHLHSTCEYHSRNQAKTERHLIRNHLYGTTHSRYDRILVVRCPTSEEYTEHADRRNSSDEEYTHVEVEDMSAHVPRKE